MRIAWVSISMAIAVGSTVPAMGDPRPTPNPYGVLTRPAAFTRPMHVPAVLFAAPPARKTVASETPRSQQIHAFRAIAQREAQETGMPYDLVDAVMRIESDYSPDRVGDVGEIGLMQIRPATAEMLGFRGPPGQLSDPAVNIHYGTLYLSQAWRLAKGDVCRTLMKYRAGHGQDGMSALSSTYCSRAQAHLVATASPLAATIKPSDFTITLGSTTAVGSEIPSPRRARSSGAFWTKFEARIKKINARIEAKWRRMASR